MRPSLATDWLSWLLTYISFVVDHRWTFRSIIDIGIDSIHIKRQIFSVNHSGARCLQPCVHWDLHACATRYLMSWHGVSKHRNTGEFRQNCRQNMGLQPDERYIAMWNSTHFDLFSWEDWYIFCVYNLTPPFHRTKDDTASSTALGGSWPHYGCDWLHVAPLAPGSNRYFKTTWKQMIH